MLFCDQCGATLSVGNRYCDICGHESQKQFDEISSTASSVSRLNRKTLIVGFLVFAGLWFAYSTHTELTKVQSDLASAQENLSQFQESTSLVLKDNQKTINTQAQQLVLAKSAADVLSQSNQQNSTSNSSAYTSIISKYESSVVKIVCLSDARGTGYQLGSGTLYKTSNTDKPYVVWTNLHVVTTQDGSSPQCVVAIYPNVALSSNYLTFATDGYQYFNSSLDFAILTPIISTSASHAGTVADLSRYSTNLVGLKFCSSLQVGDQLVVLGYPTVGGNTLTVTDGIVSGFEYSSGARYIKTSAKIDHGNSGGLSLATSGCVIGIPTYVEQGQLESIGRILDFSSIKNIIGK